MLLKGNRRPREAIFDTEIWSALVDAKNQDVIPRKIVEDKKLRIKILSNSLFVIYKKITSIKFILHCM
jgi:hypothetical protein